jgi:hypothetical protein
MRSAMRVNVGIAAPRMRPGEIRQHGQPAVSMLATLQTTQQPLGYCHDETLAPEERRKAVGARGYVNMHQTNKSIDADAFQSGRRGRKARKRTLAPTGVKEPRSVKGQGVGGRPVALGGRGSCPQRSTWFSPL